MQSQRRGSFLTSLAGVITAITGFVAAVATILAFLAAHNLWPFPPPRPEPPGLVAPSPSNHYFGSVQRGQASAIRSVAVTNERKDPTAISVELKGADKDSFALALDTCSVAPLSPGAICNLELIFSPRKEGALTARMELRLPDGVTQQVALTGLGLAPGVLSFSPTSIYLAIDSTKTGQGLSGLISTLATKPVTVTNTGLGQLTITSVQANDSHFMVSTGCHGKTLTPGQTCTVIVTFSASTNSTYNAKLLVHDNALGSPQEVSVTGYRGPQFSVFKLLTTRDPSFFYPASSPPRAGS